MKVDQKPLKFISDYISHLNEALQELRGQKLSYTQLSWIGFCLMGILLTNTVCWAKFERISFARYTRQALSWMFRRSKISWEWLLRASVQTILKKYKIQGGYLVIDDKDISRSKNAKELYRLHKIKDKKTGGYLIGQNIVLLYFVTEKISIPVGFSFYAPDPMQKEWRQIIKQFKKNEIDKSLWPTKPEPLLDYPKKYQLAIKLLEDFKRSFPEMKIKALLADALYGHLPFIQGIENIWEGIQIITKMRKNQRVLHRKKCYANHHYFSSYAGCKQEITVRGREKKIVIAGGERLYVPSHSAKRFVIAVKYENEKDYRYLMATNLSWNMKEVMQTFSILWLIEVFFADWSGYHGFCSLAKQCGFEGSLRPLILSLLFDHCFLFHVDQCDLLKQEQSLATFGSLVEKSRAQAFCHFIQKILEEESPKEKLKELVNSLDDLYPLRPSKKHMMGVAA